MRKREREKKGEHKGRGSEERGRVERVVERKRNKAPKPSVSASMWPPWGVLQSVCTTRTSPGHSNLIKATVTHRYTICRYNHVTSLLVVPVFHYYAIESVLAPLHLGLPAETELTTKRYKYRGGSPHLFFPMSPIPQSDLFPL